MTDSGDLVLTPNYNLSHLLHSNNHFHNNLFRKPNLYLHNNHNHLHNSPTFNSHNSNNNPTINHKTRIPLPLHHTRLHLDNGELPAFFTASKFSALLEKAVRLSCTDHCSNGPFTPVDAPTEKKLFATPDDTFTDTRTDAMPSRANNNNSSQPPPARSGEIISGGLLSNGMRNLPQSSLMESKMQERSAYEKWAEEKMKWSVYLFKFEYDFFIYVLY